MKTKERFKEIMNKATDLILFETDVQFYINNCEPSEIIELAKELGCPIHWKFNSEKAPYFVFQINDNISISVFA